MDQNFDYFYLSLTCPRFLFELLWDLQSWTVLSLSILFCSIDKSQHLHLNFIFVAVWLGRVIFCTLGNHSKQVAIIILPKSLTLLGNFCKGVKIIHFSIEIIFGQLLYRHLAIFIWSHWFIAKVFTKIAASFYKSYLWLGHKALTWFSSIMLNGQSDKYSINVIFYSSIVLTRKLPRYSMTLEFIVLSADKSWLTWQAITFPAK